jgi:membrane fusion protein (multidrug efflux system)
VSIRVTVKTPRRALRLGESVYGEIAVETRPNAVVIPVDALVPDADGYKVFVVDKQGIALARPVKIGGRTEAKVEILEGLSGGETVVAKGAFGVEDSVKVARPVPAKS